MKRAGFFEEVELAIFMIAAWDNPNMGAVRRRLKEPLESPKILQPPSVTD